jgi:hypothetical protein
MPFPRYSRPVTIAQRNGAIETGFHLFRHASRTLCRPELRQSQTRMKGLSRNGSKEQSKDCF